MIALFTPPLWLSIKETLALHMTHCKPSTRTVTLRKCLVSHPNFLSYMMKNLLRSNRIFLHASSLIKICTSCFESVFTFFMICWYGNLSIKAINSHWPKSWIWVQRLWQTSLSFIFQTGEEEGSWVSILSSDAHRLHEEFCYLPSGSRLRFRHCE